jgi:putative FmdB family regulatory protein
VVRDPEQEPAMPTYEYRCQDCHEVFEHRVRMADQRDAPPACPGCGGRQVEKVFSAFFANTSRKS